MAQFSLFLSLLGFWLLYGIQANSELTNIEKLVIEYSNPAVVPVQKIGQPLQVTVVFQPINVANVDEKNHAIELECIVMTSWDSRINFGRQYHDVPYITLPKKYFWLPPLNPLQSAQKMEDQAPPLVTLFNNGTVIWFATYKIRFWCDVTSIAAGASCTLSMALWGYSKDRVSFQDIGHGSFEFSHYFSGSRYTITDSGVSFIDFPFDGRVYQFANFQITVREKPSRRSRIPFRAYFQWN